MARRYRKISDLPIPGFDRAVRKSFSTTFDLIVGTGYLIGRSICKGMRQSDYSTHSEVKQRPIPSYEHLIPKPKPKKSEFKVEIEVLEQHIKDETYTMVQCERLAYIYSLIGEHFREMGIRIRCIKRFLRNSDLEYLYPTIVDAFNDPCKKPPHSICEDEEINKEYRRLIHNAELAKRKLNKY